MKNMKSPEHRTSSSSSSIVTAKKAFSFISKGWREVRSSADADLQLIKNRANSFKNLADRELENFINSASVSPFAVPSITASASTTPAEIEFVKKLQPKLSEIRRAYSSPDFKWSQWSPKPKIRIDLSAIKNAIVAEVEDEDYESESLRSWRRVGFKERETEEGHFGEFWEPIRAFKTRLKELEQKNSSSSPAEILEGIKNSELVEKFKSSLVVILFPPHYFLFLVYQITFSSSVEVFNLKELFVVLPFLPGGNFLNLLSYKLHILST